MIGVSLIIQRYFKNELLNTLGCFMTLLRLFSPFLTCMKKQEEEGSFSFKSFKETGQHCLSH